MLTNECRKQLCELFHKLQPYSVLRSWRMTYKVAFCLKMFFFFFFSLMCSHKCFSYYSYISGPQRAIHYTIFVGLGKQTSHLRLHVPPIFFFFFFFYISYSTPQTHLLMPTSHKLACLLPLHYFCPHFCKCIRHDIFSINTVWQHWFPQSHIT